MATVPGSARTLIRVGALDKALLIYSQWQGYWDRGDYANVERWLREHGIAMQSLHTSGHAAPRSLQRMAAALAARRLVPIHTFERDRYSDLFDNVTIRDDGTWWEV